MIFKELNIGDTFYIYGDGEILLKIPVVVVPELYPLIFFNREYNTICLRQCNHLIATGTGKLIYKENEAMYIYDFTKVFKC